MAQQTAVEWLIQQRNKYRLIIMQDLEQALTMEKEQQFKFFIAGQLSMEEGGKDFIQYYKETYGSDY